MRNDDAVAAATESAKTFDNRDMVDTAARAAITNLAVGNRFGGSCGLLSR
jgi:hypothetical protein